MKEFKGTKGEWYVETIRPKNTKRLEVKEPLTGVEGLGYAVAICGKIGCKEAEANAHLIAAAPELLEALQEAVYWFDSNVLDGVQEQTLDKAKQAINKALNL